MTRLLAIDPGPVESAYVVYDTDARRPLRWDKKKNWVVGVEIGRSMDCDEIAFEWIGSYGMPVGEEVFRTCYWVGRLTEIWCDSTTNRGSIHEVLRRDCKLHLCGSARAKDANVRQALIDRWGGKDTAIGRKKTPGPLYGMAGDCWQALAVAVTAAESAP